LTLGDIGPHRSGVSDPTLNAPFGARACAEYESFPGLAAKLPAPLSGAAIQGILEIGWPLAAIGANNSFTWLRDRLKDDIQNNGHVAKSDFAVVHAGAVLTELGGTVVFIKEQKGQGIRTCR
jgi:hypothetical protein